MASFQRLVIQSAGTAADFKSVCNLAPLGLPALQNFENYVGAVLGGNESAKFTFDVGAVKASATMTSTGAATAAETFTILNVTFTARASGATGNEFNLSAVVATQAANIAAAINASANLVGKVTAVAALGVVTISAVVPGLIGNGLQFSEALTNVTITQFLGGLDGTEYVLNQL